MVWYQLWLKVGSSLNLEVQPLFQSADLITFAPADFFSLFSKTVSPISRAGCVDILRSLRARETKTRGQLKPLPFLISFSKAQSQPLFHSCHSHFHFHLSSSPHGHRNPQLILWLISSTSSKSQTHVCFQSCSSLSLSYICQIIRLNPRFLADFDSSGSSCVWPDD